MAHVLAGRNNRRVRDNRLTPFDWSRPVGMFTAWLLSTWNLLLSIALGVWLMFAPVIFQTTGRAADNDHLVGALIVTFAAIAIAELPVPGVLSISCLVRGLSSRRGCSQDSSWPRGGMTRRAAILLSLARGKVRERYGSWGQQ